MSFRVIDDMATADRRVLFEQSVQGAPERVRFAVNRVSPSPNDFIQLDATGTQLFRDGSIAWSPQAEQTMLEAFQELGIPPARLDLTSTRGAREIVQRTTIRNRPSLMQIPGPNQVTALPDRVGLRRLPPAPTLPAPDQVSLTPQRVTLRTRPTAPVLPGPEQVTTGPARVSLRNRPQAPATPAADQVRAPAPAVARPERNPFFAEMRRNLRPRVNPQDPSMVRGPRPTVRINIDDGAVEFPNPQSF